MYPVVSFYRPLLQPLVFCSLYPVPVLDQGSNITPNQIQKHDTRI